MNEQDEAAALNALFEKYKPSPRDFILARLAARVEIIEFMLIESSFPNGGEKKRQVSERNLSDTLELTEHYLQLLSEGKVGGNGLHKSSENN